MTHLSFHIVMAREATVTLISSGVVSEAWLLAPGLFLGSSWKPWARPVSFLALQQFLALMNPVSHDLQRVYSSGRPLLPHVQSLCRTGRKSCVFNAVLYIYLAHGHLGL